MTMDERSRSAFTATLCAAFMASGAASLMLETLWFQQAGLVFGNDAWAASLVLCAFMAGMACGNAAGARFGDRVRNPARAYAAIELIIAVTGVAIVYALPELGRAIAALASGLLDHPVLSKILRAMLAFLLLLVPSSAMGMTLPLLVRALSQRDPRFGRVLGLLYGANTLGAVLGVATSEGVLLASLGVHGTAWVAAALSLLAAGLAWLIALAWPGATDLAKPEAAGASFSAQRRFLLAAAVSGFLLLALEAVWLRLLVLFLNDTPLVFAVVLALVLLGIALGSLLASWWAGRSQHAGDHAGLCALVAGALGVCGVSAYPSVLQRFFDIEQGPLSVAAIALPLVLPTSLASGALFTLLGEGLRQAFARDAGAAGRLTLCNTMGAALGAPAATFLLLPGLGMERSLLALFLVYGALGMYLLGSRALGLTLRVAAIGSFALAFAFFPYGQVRSAWIRGSVGRWMTRDDTLVAVREGQLATLAHVKHRLHGLPLFDQLATNAYSMSANDFAARRYMDLFAVLPAAVHSHIRSALVIGYGIGNTARALTALPELERVEVVDISQDILALARAIKPPFGQHPLLDPRVHVRIDDGRFFLEATRAHFDLITGEPPPPIMGGVAGLYSQEYFERMHERLAQGGIATYWLPMINISAATGRSIIAAFCAAFEDCSLWNGSAKNFILMGTRNAGEHGTFSEQRFSAQWNDPSLLPELRAIGLELPGQLGALFIGDAGYLRELTRDDPPLTDDWPRRMQRPGTAKERDDLIWQWRDTRAARQRFGDSALIEALWPPRMVGEALRNFENQRLITDLLFPGRSPARQVPVLHQVLTRSPLQLPLLLMLGSDPDIQAALQRAGGRAERPEWALHRAAGQLARRDPRAALISLRDVPDAALPLTGLRSYLLETSE